MAVSGVNQSVRLAVADRCSVMRGLAFGYLARVLRFSATGSWPESGWGPDRALKGQC